MGIAGWGEWRWGLGHQKEGSFWPGAVIRSRFLLTTHHHHTHTHPCVRWLASGGRPLERTRVTPLVQLLPSPADYKATAVSVLSSHNRLLHRLLRSSIFDSDITPTHTICRLSQRYGTPLTTTTISARVEYWTEYQQECLPAPVAAVANSASPSVEVGCNSFSHSCCCMRLGSCDSYSGVHTGGKHFSRDLQPLNADGEVMGMWGVCVSPLPSSQPAH